MEGLRIVIAEKDDSFRKSLKETLTHSGYLVVGEAGDGMTALKLVRSLNPELVLIGADLPVVMGPELARIIEESRLSAVVLMVGYGEKDLVRTGDRMIPLLAKPFDDFQLLSVMEYSYTAFIRMINLEKEVHRLRNDLEARKVIERAKGILMKSHGLTEEAAFRKIQQQSMKKRTSMKEIARAVITAHEMSH